MHTVAKYSNKCNFHLKNYNLSCKQLSKNFQLSLLYFDFTGAADPVIFLFSRETLFQLQGFPLYRYAHDG